MCDVKSRLLSLEEASNWRRELAEQGKKLVVTNGCFDIMHRGHASYLESARKLGDAMLILLNSDASVRALKGASRPVVCEDDRAFMLNSLRCVDRVVIFNSSRCDKELAALAPDIYVKAGDYTVETLEASERDALLKSGTEIKFMPFVPGLSTSSIIEKIKKD
ncbi:MAG: adenylyltransferase/cytidyltransferase family protein [Lentisphaeria bacterium]|nr:adenylyltransferase/cytidyltransferase family protein [Lentisphaeria bacterium]